MGDAPQAAVTSTRSPVPGGPVEPDGSSPDAETPGQGLEALARLVESGDSYVPRAVAAAVLRIAVPESRRRLDGPVAGTTEHEVVGHEISDAQWAVTSASIAGQAVRDLPSDWIAEELEIIEAVERVKAWADFQALGALHRLRTAVGEQCASLYDWSALLNAKHPSPEDMRHEADNAAVDEVAAATGLAESDVERRLDLAMNVDGRSTVMLAMLAQGDVLLSRCTRIHEATRLCSAEDVNVIAQRVLRLCKDGSTRSHASFTRELRRQVRIHEPSDELRAEDALVRRTAFGELHDDGMGTVVITGKGERVVAAMERVDDIARTLRAAGDGRTLTQLRSDVALDLLLQGRPPEGVDGIPGPLLSAPAAHVNIVVSLNTLLGLDDGVAEIPGWGFLSGAHARDVALARGSVWRRLVSDPLTGAALELSTQRYRPTAAMADLVAALDGVCRGPGCTVPAFRCDNDHQIAWPKGATSVDNLNAKHRRHHNHKTRGTWTSEMDPDGIVTWRTMGGRTYVNRRHDYDDPLGRPATDAEYDLATAADPPPPF